MASSSLTSTHVCVRACIHDIPGIAGETLWAEPLGEDRYRIANVPLFAEGINFGDVVLASNDSAMGLTVRFVVERSAHRTVRVSVTMTVPSLRVFLESLVLLYGVSVEGLARGLYAIDVPPRADLTALHQFLDATDGVCTSRPGGSMSLH